MTLVKYKVLLALELVAQRWKGPISFLCTRIQASLVHACHPRGALPAHWACRMFSESGDWSYTSFSCTRGIKKYKKSFIQ